MLVLFRGTRCRAINRAVKSKGHPRKRGRNVFIYQLGRCTAEYGYVGGNANTVGFRVYRSRFTCAPQLATLFTQCFAVGNIAQHLDQLFTMLYVTMFVKTIKMAVFRDERIWGHPFMSSTRRLRWTHVDERKGGLPHVDVHTEN